MTAATVRPEIAVLTICHNHGHFLAETMRSVRASTVTAFEHVVVLDGCTDDSALVAAREAVADPLQRVRVFTHPLRCGCPRTLNAAAARSTAPWLLKVDADDTIEPTYLEAILRAAAERPELNCIFSWCHAFGTTDYVYRYPAFDPTRMVDDFMIPGPSAWTRAMHEAVGGWDERIEAADDWDFWVRAEIAVGLKVHQIPAPLWNYRQHDGPRMSDVGTAHLAEHKARMRGYFAAAGR